MFCPHVFVVTNSYCCFFLKKIKDETEFFYIKEFEIGCILMFSSVKTSTYRYYKTKKLCLLYIIVYMHIVFFRRKKSFVIIEMKLRITLKKHYYFI